MRKLYSCVLTLCLLLFMSSCAKHDTGTASGSGSTITSDSGISSGLEASSGEATTEGLSMSSPSATTPTSNSPKVTVPMEKVPEKYYNVNKKNLKPIENVNPHSQNNNYEDEDGTIYAFDKSTGAYRGFIPPVNSSFGAKADSIEMEKLEKVADALASHFIDVAAYERSYYYQEDTSVHKFTYCKLIKGFRTTDLGNVWITSDGNIELVMFDSTGIFNSIDLPDNIDKKALDEKFYKSLDKQMACKKILNRTLTIQEKEIYMIYDYQYERNGASGRNEVYIKL